jgi:hypothetical protein
METKAYEAITKSLRVVARRVDCHLADHCRFNNGFSPRSTGPFTSVPQMLAAKPSAELRDRLIAELNELGSNDGAAIWAHRRLPEKEQTRGSRRPAGRRRVCRALGSATHG